MQTKPEDRRVRRTRRLLKESLLELMKRKPFSEISVADIAEIADVNRATFYLHYANPMQLLQNIGEDLLTHAQALLDEHLQETVGSKSIRPVLEPVLDFMITHRELCTMFFENEHESRFTENLLRLIQHNGAKTVEQQLHTGDEQRTAYLVEFVTCGLMGLIRIWFQNSMDLSKEELLTSADLLTDGAVRSILRENI